MVNNSLRTAGTIVGKDSIMNTLLGIQTFELADGSTETYTHTQIVTTRILCLLGSYLICRISRKTKYALVGVLNKNKAYALMAKDVDEDRYQQLLAEGYSPSKAWSQIEADKKAVANSNRASEARAYTNTYAV